jgi:SAM-dependent methyltransferase
VAVVAHLLEFLRRHREFVLQRLAPLLQRARLLGPTWRLYERLVGVGVRAPATDGGLPVPPNHLRVLVVGTTSAAGFLANGRLAAESVRGYFAEAGLELEDCGAVLDFGCGCGRVARHWPPDASTEWHGCDFNPRLVAWTAEHLPHVRARVNLAAPPTSYPSARFDAIYAISVFTHWPEPLQHAWLHELLRLLRPGGRLLLTTSGEARRKVLIGDELDRFDRGEFVVRFGDEPGSNLCVAFHPVSWTRERLLADAHVLVHRPVGLEDQDVWIVAPAAR